jgi:membrane protease YdiL (CAAX protease family)
MKAPGEPLPVHWEQPLRCLIAFGLLTFLPALLWQVALHEGLIDAGAAPGRPQVMGMAIFLACGAAVALFAHFHPPAVAWRPLPYGAVLRRYLPLVLPWVAFVVAYLQLMHWLGAPVAPQAQLQYLAVHGLGEPGAWLMVAGAIAVAPVAEEIVFRGYLLSVLLQVMPSWGAQAITAILFGLVHGLDYALPLALLGWFFGWLRLRHGALLPSMFAHALHNALVVALTCAWPASLDLLYPR